MTDPEKLAKIRGVAHDRAERIPHERAETNAQETADGERAAEADMDRIMNGIDREQKKGKEFYGLPETFETKAGDVKYKRVLWNSPEFTGAYAHHIQHVLGHDFKVIHHSKNGHASIGIIWGAGPEIKKGHH